MAFSSRLLDAGSAPAVPCAVKVKGGLEYQGVITVEGDLATDDYDSGLQALPTGTTQLTSARIYRKSITLYNATDAIRTVTIENSAQSQKVLDAYPLQPRQSKEINYAKAAEIIGLRWHADAAGVQGQITGFQ
jgi:hypothetical protein